MVSWHSYLGASPLSGIPLADDGASPQHGPRELDIDEGHAMAEYHLMERRRRGSRALIFAAMLLIIAFVVVSVAQKQQGAATVEYPITATAFGAAQSQLASLKVENSKQPGSAKKYDRAAFGPAWADTDHNGCDTRNDVLARDLTGATVKPGTKNCVVLTGTLDDPYTAARISFERGPRSADVQIDHVVALSNAWNSGASSWDLAQRTKFANDPANLLAVDGPANQSKSASNAAQWLPENTGYHCVYAARQIAVKSIYQLTVTKAEARALGSALSSCTVAG